MANGMISVYVPQTKRLTCTMDTFLLCSKRNNPAFQLTCPPRQESRKAGYPQQLGLLFFFVLFSLKILNQFLLYVCRHQFVAGKRHDERSATTGDGT